ncbi:hypothetical protein BGW38_010448 [Lunasporangiospora selenospora]|uniref:Uncharacterized protein n=1 Tax=Lunasporangiospora selenospora TaxID=979761 RepID=A0A9P6KFH9_9FUNG|nr:hypothetical protein BGW38_010448 [Lunasporangiospora selenospora]
MKAFHLNSCDFPEAGDEELLYGLGMNVVGNFVSTMATKEAIDFTMDPIVDTASEVFIETVIGESLSLPMASGAIAAARAPLAMERVLNRARTQSVAIHTSAITTARTMTATRRIVFKAYRA